MNMHRFLACVLLLFSLLLPLFPARSADLPFRAGVARVDIDDVEAFETIVWYPSPVDEVAWQAGPYRVEATRNAPISAGVFPVVVLSHGHAGTPFGHRQLAARLAREGFIVIAPTHVGDSSGKTEGYRQGRSLTDRPRQADKALDAILHDARFAPHMDSARIGMIGFSAGGYTALVLAGAVPDFRIADAYCVAHPQDSSSCGDRRSDGGHIAAAASAPWQFKPSYPLKALVVMDPLALVFDAAALKSVRMPVLLYRPVDGAYLDPAHNAAALVAGLPVAPQEIVVPGRHFVFLDPCPEILAAQAPLLCQDAPDVDRVEIHRRMEDEISTFMHRHL
ncbi:dienelactone hydrolase family protein [Herbaspirillum sp. RV1423]|uniref:alpha/beta hydrolase family protein n=1 Tax=Herbaspirillum sp. RV1423 TaxID=1443993 RepID=UPI0004B930F4|nr:dienelactone hydrolase family protein [Herbaspirillum sp. RV1423]